MCVIVSVAHDSKPGHLLVNARDEYVNVGGADTRSYPLSGPTPLESVFN